MTDNDKQEIIKLLKVVDTQLGEIAWRCNDDDRIDAWTNEADKALQKALALLGEDNELTEEQECDLLSNYT